MLAASRKRMLIGIKKASKRRPDRALRPELLSASLRNALQVRAVAISNRRLFPAARTASITTMKLSQFVYSTN